MIGVDAATVVGKIRHDEDEGCLVIAVRTRRNKKLRCGECAEICPGYDQGRGEPRRWRSVDFGGMKCFLEGRNARVRCRAHGVIGAQVPWARHDVRVTRAFEDTTAWLAAHADATTVSKFLRVTWRTVTGIVERVVGELAGRTDLLDGLRNIGIDEIAHRKGQRYITCVIDHDSGRLVWAKKGRNKDTVNAFFDDLGERRSKLLRAVTCDGATWIQDVVKLRAPKAKICLDAFHLMSWVSEAVDTVRRELWQQFRSTANLATGIKHTRWAVLHAPHTQNKKQREIIEKLKAANSPLYEAFLLKEQLRMAVMLKGDKGMSAFAAWLTMCAASTLEVFRSLGVRVARYRSEIANTMAVKLSNARAEATNTHLRVLTRRAYGFHSPEALIAMAMLTRGGLCPELPGRANW
jgi:transposase